MTAEKVGSAEDRKCPKCDQEGEYAGSHEERLGNSTRFYNDFKCACGAEWKRATK
jgi:DNA-directed RNA polymerase subunit M/transcription elongation factor TFIIS